MRGGETMSPEQAKSLSPAEIAALLSSTKTKNTQESYDRCIGGMVAPDNDDPWITHVEQRFNVEPQSAKMALNAALKRVETTDPELLARLADLRVIAHDQLGCVIFRVSAVGDILGQ